MTVLSVEGRLSFEHIFQPDSTNGSKPAYSATILIPKNDPQIAKIRAAIKQTATDKWHERAPKILENIIRSNSLCFRDGDDKSYDGYQDMMYITSRNAVRPTTFDRDVNPVVEADGIIYSGCYVRANIELWAQDNGNGKRINGKLLGVQFIRDGDRFGAGSGPSKASDFSVIKDEDDDSSSAKNPWD